MSDSTPTTSSFLKDAFLTYAQYSASQKQDAQKSALKWLQLHINNELDDKNILEQFGQKWRQDSNQPLSADPLYLENLPGSYKGKKSVNSHQEDALTFLQEAVPLQMQEGFKQRWDLKTKLKVSSSDGATFKIDQQEMTLLKQNDGNGDGTGWYQVADESVYYLLSHEEKGNDYLVELSEEISPQSRSTWFVAKDDVKISNI